jgi:glucosamine--fructose-6-phosphate aminotransferase (isomerizing)
VSHAFDEILSQPDTWATTLSVVPGQWSAIGDRAAFGSDTVALFVGCGTSYYLAQTASQVFQEITGIAARAIPGSEVFLSPASTIPPGKRLVAFVFSRSGTSSEAVMAARYLRSAYPNTTTIGITCTPASDLVAATDGQIVLPHADDQSVVMTRSFTNMLLAAQLIATLIAGSDKLRSELARVPESAARSMDTMLVFARTLGGNPNLKRVIYLGLGPNYGLAEEATLKLKEMTQVECEPYSPLEFRHGAISIVRDDTAAVFLAGDRERDFVADIEAQVQQYGASVASIAPYQSSIAQTSVLLPDGYSDVTRSVLYLPAVQLLAHERAIALGLDPDAPRNLGHVVVLHDR